MCDSPAAIVPRSAFNALAMSPVVLCGWSFMNSMMRPSMLSLRRRAVARRLLARRAVARRAERCGTAGTCAGVDVWRLWRGRSVDGALRLHCRRPPDPLEVSRDRRGNETQRVSQRLGPAGLDHGLELRASALSRFGCFRLRGLKSWPAGSARLPTVLPFRAGSSRVTQSHASSYALSRERRVAVGDQQERVGLTRTLQRPTPTTKSNRPRGYRPVNRIANQAMTMHTTRADAEEEEHDVVRDRQKPLHQRQPAVQIASARRDRRCPGARTAASSVEG